MKLTIPTIGVLATVIALASIGGIYAISYNSDLIASFSENAQNGAAALMLGNVKVTHFDENGDIIGYRHGSNHITVGGMQMIMGQLFTEKNATYPTLGTNVTGRIKYMQIGYGGEQTVYANQLRWNNTDILDPVGANPALPAGLCKRIRLDAIPVNTSAGWNPGPVDAYYPHPSDTSCTQGAAADRQNCAARMNHTAIATFPGANCGDGVSTIDEAGIFNDIDPQGGLMFARNTFGSVVLGNMDTLRLEWEFSFKDTVP